MTADGKRWRTGRSLGRTLYQMVGNAPSKDDVLLGMMETRELADLVVDLHNATLPREPTLLVDDEIDAARLTAIAADDRLQEILRDACDGPHEYKQHRDREEPWCEVCRHTISGRVVVTA